MNLKNLNVREMHKNEQKKLTVGSLALLEQGLH